MMLNFIINFWNDILIAVSSIVAGASALSALTPTVKDDAVLNTVKKGLDLLALNVGNAKTVSVS